MMVKRIILIMEMKINLKNLKLKDLIYLVHPDRLNRDQLQILIRVQFNNEEKRYTIRSVSKKQ